MNTHDHKKIQNDIKSNKTIYQCYLKLLLHCHNILKQKCFVGTCLREWSYFQFLIG